MNFFLRGLKRGFFLFSFMSVLSLMSYFTGAFSNSKALLFYGVILLFLGMASVIYEIRTWSFKKQIIVHYLIMLVTIFPTLLISGFFPVDSLNNLIDVFVRFNKTGLILFVVSSIIFRIRIKYHQSN
ncbi:DUF3021 family protein [Jeotgalibaca dankookensis]